MVKDALLKLKQRLSNLSKAQAVFILSLGLGVSLVSFLLWIWLTVVPVVVIETKYQFKKFLHDVIQVESLSDIFILDFSGLNTATQTRYREYGIVIPKVFVNEAVIFNVDPHDKAGYTQALRRGIAHASGTAFPDTGGLGYYFAHSTSAEFRNQLKAVFYLLGKLKPGDEIYIWFEGNKYTYQVTKTEVTRPEDTGFLDHTYSQETIVLQTCWPPGSTQKRLLVFATRVD